MREATYEGLLHPEWIEGRLVWSEGGTVGDIVRKLQHGDPAKGWEGDLRLAVTYNKPADCWELWRLEHDGQYRLVARKPPGSPLDDRIIDELIAHDTRRGFNPHAAVVANNEKVRRAEEDARTAELVEAWDRLTFAARKEIG